MMTIIFLSALAALIELDDTLVGQFGFASPFVAGIILGLLFGDVSAGLQAGAFITLLLFDYTPVGGVIVPNGTVSVFCTVLLASFGVSVHAAFFVGILCGVAYKSCERLHRAYAGRQMIRRERAFALCPQKSLRVFMLKSAGLKFLITFVFLSAFGLISRALLGHLPAMSDNVALAFKLSYFTAAWLGIMMAFKKFTVAK